MLLGRARPPLWKARPVPLIAPALQAVVEWALSVDKVRMHAFVSIRDSHDRRSIRGQTFQLEKRFDSRFPRGKRRSILASHP